ncbi:hypothetical protein DENSPDRAFT_851782 [Dentipellis sp. KUC8613]|nr:hypothetical protein DENSPDRAFT_851782 [Dentipellis sp. KUC8613]
MADEDTHMTDRATTPRPDNIATATALASVRPVGSRAPDTENWCFESGSGLIAHGPHCARCSEYVRHYATALFDDAQRESHSAAVAERTAYFRARNTADYVSRETYERAREHIHDLQNQRTRADEEVASLQDEIRHLTARIASFDIETSAETPPRERRRKTGHNTDTLVDAGGTAVPSHTYATIAGAPPSAPPSSVSVSVAPSTATSRRVSPARATSSALPSVPPGSQTRTVAHQGQAWPADEGTGLVPRSLTHPKVGGPLFSFLGVRKTKYHWPTHVLKQRDIKASLESGAPIVLTDVPIRALRFLEGEADPRDVPDVDRMLDAANQPGNHVALARVKEAMARMQGIPNIQHTEAQRELQQRWRQPEWVKAWETGAPLPPPPVPPHPDIRFDIDAMDGTSDDYDWYPATSGKS